MSNLIVVDRDKITAIADAIREKTESDLSYTIDEMPDAIRIIKGGGASGDGTIFVPELVIGDDSVRNGISLEITVEN